MQAVKNKNQERLSKMAYQQKGEKMENSLSKKLKAGRERLVERLLCIVVDKAPHKSEGKVQDKGQDQKQDEASQKFSHAVRVFLYKGHQLLRRLKIRQSEKIHLAGHHRKNRHANEHWNYKKSGSPPCPSLPQAREQKIKGHGLVPNETQVAQKKPVMQDENY